VSCHASAGNAVYGIMGAALHDSVPDTSGQGGRGYVKCAPKGYEGQTSFTSAHEKKEKKKKPGAKQNKGRRGKAAL